MKMRAWMLLIAMGTAVQAQQVQRPPATAKKTMPAEDPGARAFKANCSRCHSAPEQIPPRIAGTVLKHMRVRASLSEADQKAILRYFAP
jgi:cytochrome c5